MKQALLKKDKLTDWKDTFDDLFGVSSNEDEENVEKENDPEIAKMLKESELYVKKLEKMFEYPDKKITKTKKKSFEKGKSNIKKSSKEISVQKTRAKNNYERDHDER